MVSLDSLTSQTQDGGNKIRQYLERGQKTQANHRMTMFSNKTRDSGKGTKQLIRDSGFPIRQGNYISYTDKLKQSSEQ